MPAAAEHELALAGELASIIAEGGSLKCALHQSLARICSATGWDLGEAWMPWADTGALQCRMSWAYNSSLEPFLAAAGEHHAADLAMQVWHRGAPAWITEIQTSELVARKREAARVGLQSAAAVPLPAGTQTVGVLAFFSRERRDRDPETVRLLSVLAGHLGPMVRLRETCERRADGESRFRALAETTVDAVISADRHGRMVYLNPRAEELFGYRQPEAVGRPFACLVPERHRGEHAAKLERLMSGVGSVQPIDLTGLRADGTEFPIELSVGAHDEAGGGAVVTCLIRDTTERNQVERRYRRREAQLAEAQALAKLGSWEWDAQTGEEQWSEEMFRIYGLAPGRRPPSSELIPYRRPDDRRTLSALWERALKEGRPFSVFHRIVRDGRELTLHVQGKPNFDDDGKVVSLAGTTQDVTEQLRLENERRQAEQRFRGAFENAPIGMTMIHPDGRLVRVNEALGRMSGYPRKTLEGADFREFTHPDDLTTMQRALGRLVRGERRSVCLPQRYRDADGSWIEARVSISLIVDAADKPTLFIAQLEDVTAKKHTERAFLESRERFQAILDNAPMAVHMKDLEGRYVLVNRMAASLAGLHQEDFLGKAAAELSLTEPVLDLFTSYDEQVQGSKAPVPFEREIETADGVRTFLTEKFPVVDSEGKVYAVAAVSVDITERVKVEDENRRLESELHSARRLEAVGGLAGGIAHDFNNLLAVILNYAVLAREDVESASIARELEEIQRAAERAADLTRKLLVFSRQEQVEPQVLDLNSVVVGAEWLLRRTLGEHIELWVELGDDLWPVEGDAGQLEGILLNLAVNAGHAMPAGGTLSIRTENVTLDSSGPATRPAGRYVRLSVSDTGSGMTDEVAARAFEPFFTTRPTGEGTGLGLATVHGIARQAGGTVELSTRPRRGTSVITYLPASDRELTPQPPAPVPKEKGEGQAIVVVEDEPAVRGTLCRILTRAGYSVREASPTCALEACACPDIEVDLLLTDVVMPKISGGELAARARDLCPDLKVLYMSGYVDEAKLGSRTHELVPILQKPFSPEQLLHAVEQVLEGPSTAD